jgi:hypothetical protein
MSFQFNRTRKPEPLGAITVHLWHRQPDPSKVMTLKATMKGTRGMSHASLVIHQDTEQQPGTVVIDGEDSWSFDLRLFRLMCHDIL